jgi:hypothetical protein
MIHIHLEASQKSQTPESLQQEQCATAFGLVMFSELAATGAVGAWVDSSGSELFLV